MLCAKFALFHTKKLVNFCVWNRTTFAQYSTFSTSHGISFSQIKAKLFSQKSKLQQFLVNFYALVTFNEKINNLQEKKIIIIKFRDRETWKWKPGEENLKSI